MDTFYKLTNHVSTANNSLCRAGNSKCGDIRLNLPNASKCRVPNSLQSTELNQINYSVLQFKYCYQFPLPHLN